MPTPDPSAATAGGSPRPIAGTLLDYPAIYLPRTPGSVREGDTVPFDEFIKLSETAFEVLMHYRCRASRENAADLRRLKPAVYERLFTNQNRLRTPYFVFPEPVPGSLSSLHRSKKFELSTLVRDLCRNAFPPGVTISSPEGRGPVSEAVAGIGLFYHLREAESYWLFDFSTPDGKPARKPSVMCKGRFIV